MAGYVPFDPNKPLQAPAPADAAPAAAPAKPGGYVPYDPNAAPTGGQQQTTGGAQSQQTTGGAQSQQTTGGASQPADWSIDWSKGGEVKFPQSVQDWSTLAAQNSWMGLPGAPGKAQAEAARKRLDPVTASSADLAGNVLSPTTLLMGLPGGAPIAGGLHEGIKSYEAGNPWTTVADDAAMGTLSGFGGQLVAKAAPAVLPQLTKAAVDLGPAAAMTTVAHKVFGDPSKDILSALGGYALMRNMSEGAGEAAKKVAEWAPTQQAIKSLILGGSSAFRQGTGPWDQWIPGQ